MARNAGPTAALMTFDDWREAVGMFIAAWTGLRLADLPDWHYRNACDAEVSPVQAAREVLAANRPSITRNGWSA